MKKVLFIKNALILTATSLLLRFLGVVFRIWLSAKIGSEGIGLYQIIFSFYMLAATFATSGIYTAVTRLVADEMCVGSAASIKKIMRRSFSLIILLALVSLLVVFFGAEFIAVHIISDIRATLAIRTLSFSLIFMGISSCIKGFFLARRKSVPPSLSQIIEQIVRILVVMFHVKQFASISIDYACAAVLVGDVIAEFSSCLYLYLCYRRDTHRLSPLVGRPSPDFSITKRLIRISLPITSGKYINSILRIIESSLVPQRLVMAGLSRADALSFFGMIKGMALPILFFPSSLLNSLSTLLIPEISEATAKGHSGILRRAVEKIIFITALFGFIFAAVFFFCGESLGEIIYKSRDVGSLIKTLAPLVPLMYLDSISDGILKGMDQQNATFRNSVSDSAGRIVLIFFLLPIYREAAFIWIMYLSNAYTCLLNLARLIRVSGAKIKFFRKVLLPCFLAFALTYCISSFGVLFNFSLLAGAIFVCSCSCVLYFLFLLAFGCIKKEEMRLLT